MLSWVLNSVGPKKKYFDQGDARPIFYVRVDVDNTHGWHQSTMVAKKTGLNLVSPAATSDHRTTKPRVSETAGGVGTKGMSTQM